MKIRTLRSRKASNRKQRRLQRFRSRLLRCEALEDRMVLSGIGLQEVLAASNAGQFDEFGSAIAVDGDIMVVGAPLEDSAATGVNGNESDNSATSAGAAYVFRDPDGDGDWSDAVQDAYLKASNTDSGDWFGWSVAVSDETIVVGTRGEDSAATGVNGNESDYSAGNAGAAYVFRDPDGDGDWSDAVQDAYLKASNTDTGDVFGTSVAVSGGSIVVGAVRDEKAGLADGTGTAVVFGLDGPPPTSTVLLDNDGNLLVDDVVSDGKDDLLTLIRNGGNVHVHDPENELTAGSGAAQIDAHTVEVTLASITGEIRVNTAGGDDLVTIDFSGGDPIPTGGLGYDGGDGGFDTLEITGGAFNTSTYTYDTPNDGSISLDPDGPSGAAASLITYAGLEPITSSVTSDVVELIYTGDDETITVSDAGNDQTTVDSTLGETTTFINPTDLLKIQATGGTDTIDVDSLASGYAALKIEADDASDMVNFNGPLTFAADHGLTVSNVGTVNLPNSNSDIATSGTGAVSLTALKNIALASGSSIATVDGGVALEANQQATSASGNFVGIVVNGAAITTSGAGDISLVGRGGGGASGVSVNIAAVISSTGTGAHAGTITLDGTGGDGTHHNNGVRISSASQVTSVDGDILITGQGGGDGSGGDNVGVSVGFSAVISSTGTDVDAATITLDGTGGDGTSSNSGVRIQRSGTQVTSVQGDILITGRGGDGSGSHNVGVRVSSAAVISSTGTGADAPTITVDGTGGDGTSSNRGVTIANLGTEVTSVDGAILIAGRGGNGSGSFNQGVGVSAAVISSTGTGADAATITVDGDGGKGTRWNQGVQIRGPVASVDGDILITGRGGDGSDNMNHGVFVMAVISSTGTGADAATITLDGTGGNGTSNAGVRIERSGTQVTSVDGDILITGHGGDGSSGGNHGVHISDAVVVSSTGTGAEAATITIKGTGAETSSNHGVQIRSSGTQVTSVDGDIEITGRGANASDSVNKGVSIGGAAVVSSTGKGTEAATITIEGSGGAGKSFNYGVQISNSGTQVTSVDGDIEITGQGGDGSSSSNYGVYIVHAAVVSSTGTGAEAATIRIDGTGGDGTRTNRGVAITNSGTEVTSVDGDIEITGQGGDGSSYRNYGVYISQAVVSSTGTGAEAATITVKGTGGAGTARNTGVWIFGSETQVTSVDGPIQISGARGSGVAGAGIGLRSFNGIHATNTAAVTLIADSMNISETNAVVASSSTVTVQQRTNGTAIDLGTNTAGTLGLTDNELDRITAEKLVIGDSNSGDLVVSGPVTRTASTDVELHSGGAIRFDPGSLDTGGGDLLLAPGAGGVQPISSGVDITAATAAFASDLHISVSGTTLDTEYAQLNVDGTVDLDGVDLVLSGSYEPQNNDVFTIVSATSVANQFDGLSEGDEVMFNGQPLTINYTQTAVTLTADSNSPPVAHAGGPYEITVGDDLALDASESSDPDGDDLTFSWDLTDNGEFTDATGESATLDWDALVALGLDAPGEFEVALKADDDSETNVATTTLTILHATPTVEIDWTGGTYNGVAFEATGTVTGFDGGELGDPTLTYFVGADTDGAQLSAAPVDAGVYTVQADYAGDTLHTSASETAVIVIEKAELIVDIDDASWEIATEFPVFTGEISGAVSGESFTAEYSSEADETSTVGIYEITAEVFEDVGELSNYEVLVNSGTLTVDPAEVDLDIRRQSLNIDSNGALSLVMLGASSNFDLAEVDLDGLSFAGVEITTFNQTLADADGDGKEDLTLHFRMTDELQDALEDIYKDLVLADYEDDGDFSRKQLATLELEGTFGEHDQQFQGSDAVDIFFSGRALREVLNDLDLA